MDLSEKKLDLSGKKLLGVVLNKRVNIKVEILELEKDIPENEVDNFREWVLSTALEVGLGKHLEYYDYTDNYLDAIPVVFIVTI
jgi:hypothetical protein